MVETVFKTINPNSFGAQLLRRALQRAITLRRPPPGMIHHSDRGSQYCSDDYRRVVEASGSIASMRGRGNSYCGIRAGYKSPAAFETTFRTNAWREQMALH